ncbi:MAG: putative ABC-type transport system involved in lysophospholipase L1 biosynthesis ATPase subunit [Ilumatobacter sp.]
MDLPRCHGYVGYVGFVLQGFNLIPSLNARENVAVRDKDDVAARSVFQGRRNS